MQKKGIAEQAKASKKTKKILQVVGWRRGWWFNGDSGSGLKNIFSHMHANQQQTIFWAH